jgi:hypothetical protein
MDGIPLRAFLDLLTQGVVQPRRVMRRLLDLRPSTEDRLTLVALAAVLQGFLWTLSLLLAPSLFGGAMEGGVGLFGHVALAGVVFLNFVVTTVAAHAIGRRFGGQGSVAEVATAVAWHGVLAAALTPLQAMALGGGAPGQPLGGGAALSVVLYAGLNLWLLASCLAEAHRFESTARVAGVTLAAFFALGLVFSLFLSLGAAR